MREFILAGVAAIALVACSGSAHAEGEPTIAAAVADSARPAADTARDADRKPAEIVAFAGVKPGDKIAEMIPGGGYYTRILAKSVGPEGHVYALVPPFFAQRPGGLDGINAIAAQYGNVSVVLADLASFTLAEPVDLVWTSENYHDMHNGPQPDPAGVNEAAFAALKPGGAYFVEDHAAPGAGPEATTTIHRINPDQVKQEVEAAGFTLEAQSDVLVNPKDPGDISPRDVTDGVSSKFAFRFRKPG